MNTYQWLKISQSFLFPPVCVLCGGRGHEALDLCAACLQSLPTLGSTCVRCAEPLTGIVLEALCGRCQAKPLAFERCQALFHYAYPLDTLLQRLKFSGRLEMALILGHLMADRLSESLDEIPDCLIPVPLHTQRLRERGFNQALELARPISRRLRIPLDFQSCVRLHATPPQAGLSRKERRKNLKNAFTMQRKVPGHVAVIDDVMTTGSTAHELARVLLKNGAKRVDVWVCARA